MKRNRTTQADIQAALETFRRKGGLIRRLPAQIVPPRTRVPISGATERLGTFLARLQPLD